jgi:hypothetical protein
MHGRGCAVRDVALLLFLMVCPNGNGMACMCMWM